MEITHKRKIQVPQLRTDGSDASEEYNARAFNWVRRTASPTLDEYVLNPFETAMKDAVLKEAHRSEKSSEGDYLQQRHTKRWDLGGVSFQAAAYRHSSIAHETVYGRLQSFLQDCIEDNLDTVHREFVRKTKRGPHVSALYVLDSHVLWKQANTKVYNKQDLQVFEAGTEKAYKGVEAPCELVVALDSGRFSKLNETNAQTYLRARALGKQLDGFVKDFTTRVRERHGLSVTKGEHEVDYALADGSAVRYLFFSKDTSVSYGKMLDCLMKPVEGESFVASTGDIELIRAFGFKAPYSIGGRGKLDVSTEVLKYHLGMCTLDRAEKGQVKYSIFDNEHKGVYVKARDVLYRMAELRRADHSQDTQMKVDFFPGAPVGL